MQVNIDINCCAYAELIGFNDKPEGEDHYGGGGTWEGSKEAVRLVAQQCCYDDDDPDASLILMTYAWDRKPQVEWRQKSYGKRRMDDFLRYIERHNLGRVTAIPQHTNPNHNSCVKSYVWAISRRGIDKWCTKHIPKPAWADNRAWRL
jgi:hypothetical protein